MFHPDDTIGPYTLVHTLGRGAFGEVWLAERHTALLTMRVALKLPLVSVSEVDAFRNEALLWQRASGHPNIVPVLDANLFDGQVVIASEYIAGGSLHEWLQVRHGGAPSLEDTVAMATGILAGLDYLHRAGLTHRDLKPENVLLQDGIPRLTDFGLARVLATEARTGNIAGTPRYMAPETFSGAYSAASDLWALGVMLHELLANSHPFPTGDLMALMAAIQSHEPAALPATIPERLRAIVTRLLAKDPSARYPTASAVREALLTSLHAPAALAGKQGSSSHPNNLPAQMTSFIGREREIDDLAGLVTTTRLLTLTGSGGSGKTRLALRVAEQVMPQFEDGVWLVELAPLADSALVPQTVAATFGVKEEPGKSILQTLADNFRSRTFLLLLDNCEHLLTACAHMADAILRHCPSVRILASSREALGIIGETTYRVPSLSLPDPTRIATIQSLVGFEAVQLFIERAIQAKTDFAVTDHNAQSLASICRRLDGIPLAIELAAARVRAMPIEQIEQRLDQRFRLLTGGSRTALPRQQTLRSLIDWSFDLLSHTEKALLCRLSVFVGGWTMEAAEEVCSDRGSEGVQKGGAVEVWELLDLLTSLSDKSLVIYQETEGVARYRLLETVRQYARDRLLESGEAETWRARHLAFYRALAEEAEPKLKGPDQQAWLEQLETEHDNVRAALEWGGQDVDSADARLRLASALSRFWDVRGHLTEGRERLAWVLGLYGSAGTEARANALNAAGVLAYRQCDYPSARALYQESLAIRRELGDRSGIAGALGNLGNVARSEADFPSARTLCQESLAIQRQLGDRFGIGMTLNNLATVADDQGDYPTARALAKESLAIHRELGDQSGIARALISLGILNYGEGDYPSARLLHEESLAIQRQLGDRFGVAMTVGNLANLAYDQGDYPNARTLVEESLAIFRELGDRSGIARTLNIVGQVSYGQGDYPSARSHLEAGLAIFNELGNRLGIAQSLEAFAGLVSALERCVCASRLWGAAERIREEIGAPLPRNERENCDREIKTARAALGDDAAFAAGWQEGRALTMEQAIEAALTSEK